jgi:hypothetical protein
MAKEYAIDELSTILGLSADKITAHLEKYQDRGEFSYSTDAAGFKNYSSLAMYLVLKEELGKGPHKPGSKLEKRDGEIILKKKSLDELVKAAKVAGSENIYGQVEKPTSNKGSGYTGKIRYFLKPTKGVEISYEETYAVDNLRELDDIRMQLSEELRKITGKEKIPSQLL